MSTVRIIIIGNEILTGKFVDENTPYLIKECNKHKLEIEEISIIRDDIDLIAHHVREASKRSTYVITTGGVGPTHDDMTMKGVAKAFGTDLVEAPELSALIKKHIGDNPAALRMALVPKNYTLWDCGEKLFPQVVVENVFVFPGIPKLMAKKFQAVVKNWTGAEKIHRKINLNTYESIIALRLEEIQTAHPSVEIGSYPRYDEAPVTLILTIDGTDEESINIVDREIRTSFAQYIV